MTAIMFLVIGIIMTGIFVCTLVLNQNHTAMAQQQPTGMSFQMYNNAVILKPSSETPICGGLLLEDF
jgi:hypothetical protein